jgi:hypothetical protein
MFWPIEIVTGFLFVRMTIAALAGPASRLAHTYRSQVSGLPDTRQFHSTIAMTLATDGIETILTVALRLSPVHRGSGWEIGEDSGAKHVAFYWRMAQPMLKRIVEHDDRRADRRTERSCADVIPCSQAAAVRRRPAYHAPF